MQKQTDEQKEDKQQKEEAENKEDEESEFLHFEGSLSWDYILKYCWH